MEAIKSKTKPNQKQLSEFGSCDYVKEETDVLGSPSLIVRTVSVDVEQH